MASTPEEPYPHRRLRRICIFLALALGALYYWGFRHEIGGDGISYLDFGDAIVRGDRDQMINGTWSPLYPALLGVSLLITNPSPYWESSVASLVNFLIYVLALFSFNFLLRELIRFHQDREGQRSEEGYVNLPAGVLLLLGYAIFIWASLMMIGTGWSSIILRGPGLSPDMLVAMFVYLASAILLRIRKGSTGLITFAVLGAVLGLSYLAKAVMFPLSFVFLGAGFFLIGNLRRAAPRAALALIIFLATAGVYIVPLSVKKERLTFGDTGAFSYAHFLNGTPHFHWQGEPPGSGTPRHPTRKIFDQPAIYEFGTPVGGSYPPWYDPSYWCEGLTPHLDLKQQVKVMARNASLYYYPIFFSEYQVCLLLGFLILLLCAGRGRRSSLKGIGEYWYFLIPAIAALILYWLVYVESRHVAPFIVLLWLGLFSGLRLSENEESRRLLKLVPISIVIMMGAIIFVPVIRQTYSVARELMKGENASANLQWQVADGLNRMGIQPGDKVASLGLGNQWDFYWARLARVKIVVEAPDPDSFWTANESVRAEAIKTFAATGARALVAKKPGGNFSTACCFTSNGWQRIGNTDYYAYPL